jgi:hypothetical protein
MDVGTEGGRREGQRNRGGKGGKREPYLASLSPNLVATRLFVLIL